MSSHDQEPLSEREAFENGFWYFSESLEILAAPAHVQCERMGNYNVAWELKDDVQAAGYLLQSPSSGRLSVEQRQGISNMVQSLDAIPAEVLVSCTTVEGNALAMSRPCWVPIREQARLLLGVLAPAIDDCRRYLDGKQT